MGTRNLTAVVSNGQYKIAQYGQWDGNPEGQGATALQFCRKYLSTAAARAKFVRILKRTKFVTKEDQDKLWSDLGINAKDGHITSDEADRFHATYPYFSRDHGADILEMVAKTKKTDTVLLYDQSAFAADSLFCEYGYVVDLDKKTFEVYRGFNTKPLPAGERFSDLPQKEKISGAPNEYYPIKFVAAWKLYRLPTEAVFLKEVHKVLKKWNPEYYEDN